MKFLSRQNSSPQGEIESKLKASFSKIREEFEEHLLAINENTNEIAQNHEYLSELEAKFSTLGERLDTMELFLKQYGFAQSRPSTFSIRPLSTEEKKVFLALYTIEDEKGHVTYSDIASTLLMDTHLVSGYLSSLMEKGVPIVKRYVNDIAYLRLDQDFKGLQAKENILQIDRSQKQLMQF